MGGPVDGHRTGRSAARLPAASDPSLGGFQLSVRALASRGGARHAAPAGEGGADVVTDPQPAGAGPGPHDQEAFVDLVPMLRRVVGARVKDPHTWRTWSRRRWPG